MLVSIDEGLYGIETMGGGVLVFGGNCIIVKESLEGLAVLLGLVFCVWINIEGFDEVDHSCVKDLPLLCLVWHIK